MKLYLVHCGFYDPSIGDGIFEGHANYFVAAESFEAARERAKQLPEFQSRRMHVDGLQEVEAVEGFRIRLEPAPDLEGKTWVRSHRHRELAPSSRRAVVY